jgi:hypothetical protein
LEKFLQSLNIDTKAIKDKLFNSPEQQQQQQQGANEVQERQKTEE